MAIAYDTENHAFLITGKTMTFTPVGTPRGIIVFVATEYPGAASDQLTGITYGGVTMNEVALSPSVSTSGENSCVSCFFLGSSIPTGAQTVELDTSNPGYYTTLGVISVTAAQDTEVVDTTVLTGLAANPSGTLSLGGASCFCAEGGHSGVSAVGSITPFSNWTSSAEYDYGATCGYMYKYDVIGTTDVTFGVTQSSDDYNIFGIAIKESAAAGALSLLVRKAWSSFKHMMVR